MSTNRKLFNITGTVLFLSWFFTLFSEQGALNSALLIIGSISALIFGPTAIMEFVKIYSSKNQAQNVRSRSSLFLVGFIILIIFLVGLALWNRLNPAY